MVRVTEGINTPPTPFSFTAHAVDAGHSVGITAAGGIAYTWGRTNNLGQLGRQGKAKVPAPVRIADVVVVVKAAFVGGMSDSGHTVILDPSGGMWVTGCDRWQQLGLGSPNGGAGGYTWSAGKVFQTTFQRNTFVPEFVKRLNGGGAATIRDVALGGDHTVVLSSNQRDVVTFGKGGEGQLGLKEKRFLSAATRSSVLSSSSSNDDPIAAVCAIEHCSLTLDETGAILNKAGKCRTTQQSFKAALDACRKRAAGYGLIKEVR